jgi:predicted RND superfamily exporter protein
MFRRLVGSFVDAAGRRPALVLLFSVVFMALCWGTSSGYVIPGKKLELRPDIIDLLPRDSQSFKSFEHQLGRVGGGATFLVVAESPDRKANQRFTDDLSAQLEKQANDRAQCVNACAKDDVACKLKCGPDFISYVESGTKDTKKFFEDNKWLYAEMKDLQEADDTLDHQIAIRSGLVTALDEDDDADAGVAQTSRSGATPPTPAVLAPSASPPDARTPTPPDGGADPNAKQPTLGMDPYYNRWKDSSKKKHEDFPTGYFTNDAGTLMVVRIVSNASGYGGYTGDLFLSDMTKRIDAMHVTETYHPEMRIGFAGDIPNAVAEKESTIDQAVWATGVALVLILLGIVFFYRSAWSLIVIALPTFMGIGAAYAFATLTYGYVNLPGAFLGAIILGNGINYPIVLLSRYREFRARGMDPAEARREAVLNAFRAELVGAAVASIAYGSLSITHFQGFSQFGLIGFVGMFLVWAAIIPVVPALVVTIEWVQSKLPRFLRDPRPGIREDGSSGPFMRLVARATERFSLVFVAIAIAASAYCATKIPAYLRDPWEYNFAKLGSRGNKAAGSPGEWSNRADEVFRGKQNISGTLILADTPEQVPMLKAKILESDRADPEGSLIEEIVTAADFLPGSPEEQKQKLDVLDSIRDRLTPGVMGKVSADERTRLEEMKPPETLRALTPKDLPALLRRRFEEKDGRVGTVMYIKYKFGVSFSNGRTVLRMAKSTNDVKLPDGSVVQTGSRSTIFSEIIHSMEHDGPIATFASFFCVMIVVVLATRSKIGAFSVLLSLLLGVTILVGGAAITETQLNFFNFIALPITFGIGCEYPFNVFDRTRLLSGDVKTAVSRTGAAVALCSYTTTVGYASMLFADNQALQSFGRLAMWGEIACVAMALLFLPSLLHLLLRKSSRAAAAEEASDAAKKTT